MSIAATRIGKLGKDLPKAEMSATHAELQPSKNPRMVIEPKTLGPYSLWPSELGRKKRGAATSAVITCVACEGA